MIALLKAIAAGYKRRRHSLGFGVHSPAAYRMVRDVLMERRGYAYYAYDEVEALADGSLQRRRARMLHRLAARYPAGNAIVDPSLPTAWRKAVESAHGVDDNPLIVTSGLPTHLPTEGIAVMFSLTANELNHLAQHMSSGVLLEGRDAAIAILSSTIHFVRYTVII